MRKYNEMKIAVEKVGYEMVYWFHLIVLFAIGVVVVISSIETAVGVYASGHAKVEDILLLFIYLELGAMVGIYFTTSRMPVNFLLYVGITALTRAIVGNLPHDHKVSYDLLILTGAVFILALTVMVLKFSSAKFQIKPKKGKAALFHNEDSRGKQ
jgi:phosphate starvation-inducible membrane PsiE